MSTIVAHHYPYGIGVDTHAATHTFAVLDNTGVRHDMQTIPTTAAGMRRALAWAGRRTAGDLAALWVIGGIGSYGGQFAQAVETAGYTVVEAARMTKKSRNDVGKNDAIDAHRIASTVLSLTTGQLRKPRDNKGVQAALKTLLSARDVMGRERTRAINALTALLRTTDLGIDARRALSKRVITQVAQWRTRQEALATATARVEAIRLAKRVREADQDLRDNDAQITELLKHTPAAGLTQETGVGPVSAATVLVAWGYHGRIRSEAAFAALAGASPLPASFGTTIRYRLNRGGDRKLNRALNVNAIHRMIHHQDTRDYVKKRLAQGKPIERYAEHSNDILRADTTAI